MAKMLEIEPFLANIQVNLANYEKVDQLHAQEIGELHRQIEQLKAEKCDFGAHKDFKEFTEEKLKDMA